MYAELPDHSGNNKVTRVVKAGIFFFPFFLNLCVWRTFLDHKQCCLAIFPRFQSITGRKLILSIHREIYSQRRRIFNPLLRRTTFIEFPQQTQEVIGVIFTMKERNFV